MACSEPLQPSPDSSDGPGKHASLPVVVCDVHVEELWRYPVKSLRGEQIGRTDVLADGIAGDRVVHVREASGRVVTSRYRPGLLALAGTPTRTASL